MLRLLPAFILLLAAADGFAAAINLTDLPHSELVFRQVQDRQALKIYRQGLSAILAYIEQRPDLFPPSALNAPRLLQKEARNEAVIIWKSLLDYYLAMDSIAALHRDFLHIKHKELRCTSLHIARMAFLAAYRFALDFIRVAENDPALDTVLDEPVPELGLPGGMYATFKYRFLNIMAAGEFAALEAVAAYCGDADDAQLTQDIEADRQKIWAAGKGEGPGLTFKNGIDILKRSSQKAWFPIQKGVPSWMGATKVYRHNEYLIKPAQIKEFQSSLEPGDILLERREWYLTNVGIPGFWSHAALYMGTAQERTAFFDEPQTRAWAQQQGARTFEDLLKQTYPETYPSATSPAEDGNAPRVIEAIADGVVFTSLEFSAACDSLAVLRPRLEKKEKALALWRAFRYYGRPYDYNFDFLTENSLVCTELVYKAYAPVQSAGGLRLPLERIAGHWVTPANVFARHFSDHYATRRQQMDLILFMDGYEKKRMAL
ncbi:MAG: hypothetical protein JSW39_10590, partial [Desulfobacterales bacterium]